MLPSIDDLYNAAQLHVDGGCNEGGCKKNQEELDDVGSQHPVGTLLSADDAADVADELDWTKIRGQFRQVGNSL